MGEKAGELAKLLLEGKQISARKYQRLTQNVHRKRGGANTCGKTPKAQQGASPKPKGV